MRSEKRCKPEQERTAFDGEALCEEKDGCEQAVEDRLETTGESVSRIIAQNKELFAYAEAMRDAQKAHLPF